MELQALLKSVIKALYGEKTIGRFVIVRAITQIDLLIMIPNKNSEGGIKIKMKEADINVLHIDNAKANKLLLKAL